MPETNQIAQLNEILNDLVIVNFRELKTLKKTISKLKNADQDLVPVFDYMVMECRHHINNLMILDFSKGKEGHTSVRNYELNETDDRNGGAIAIRWAMSVTEIADRERELLIATAINTIAASLFAYETALENTNIQNANPLIQRDLNIQMSNFKKFLRRLKNLK